jgi:hypothetical protein
LASAVLYRDRKGKLRAVAALSRKRFRSAEVHEFPERDAAIHWAERTLPEDTNWQLIELDEL